MVIKFKVSNPDSLFPFIGLVTGATLLEGGQRCAVAPSAAGSPGTSAKTAQNWAAVAKMAKNMA
jgi:hypothetical protein